MTATSHFPSEHAGALQDLAAYGAPVTFTQTRVNYIDAPTDETSTPITDTVTGYAMRVRGNPVMYAAQSLIESEAPTLLFAPDVIGTLPRVGAVLADFGGESYTVAAIYPVAPDGVPILARIMVQR